MNIFNDLKHDMDKPIIKTHEHEQCNKLKKYFTT